MTITRYEFGHIEIDGQNYDQDVIVYDHMIDSPWWRQQGHNLFINDLTRILEEQPEVLIVGTGFYGRMQVSDELLSELRKQGIEPQVFTTQKAVEEFNQLQQQHKHVAAALHLTC